MKMTIWKNDKYEIKYGGMEKYKNNNWQYTILVLNNKDKSMCVSGRFAKKYDEND